MPLSGGIDFSELNLVGQRIKSDLEFLQGGYFKLSRAALVHAPCFRALCPGLTPVGHPCSCIARLRLWFTVQGLR
jgi:hypothetical protein